ncbi:MAG: LysR family transcriptional regulator [Lachnospiraceae bacterium]|nr:LysR family transcriptional regulator [Lachnospiraceae bacterium]
MNLRQVEAFCRLAKTKNFSQAAEQMYVSQPAFSRMIESLEKEFGHKLFVRSKTNPRLTEVGDRILKWMDNIKQNYDSINGVLRLAEDKQIGILRIGMLDNGLTRAVRDKISQFHMLYPDVRLELKEYSEADMGKALDMEWVDVAFVQHRPFIQSNHIAEKVIGTNNLVVAVHRSNVLSNRRTIAMKDLRDEPIVALSEYVSRLGSENLTSLFLKNHITPNIVMTADNATNALVAVDCNIGLTLIPDQMKEVAGWNVVFVPLEEQISENYRVLWLKENNNSQIEKFLGMFD